MVKTSKLTEAKSQPERFIETARELECDEDIGRFEEKLGKIATARVEQKRRRPIKRKIK